MNFAESKATSGNSSVTHDDRTEGTSYLDCILGRAKAPKEGPNFNAFQMMMVGGMIFTVSTLNGFTHMGIDFVFVSHWAYPVMFAIGLLIRVTIANAVVGRIMRRPFFSSLEGLKRNIANSVVNVSFMATMISAANALLLNGVEGYFATLLPTLPSTIASGILIHYFIVSPAVKLLYARWADQGFCHKVFGAAHRYEMPWTALFGN